MTKDEQTRTLIRDRVLKLLSDSEVANVSSTEALNGLAVGEEYIDLVAIDRGVCRSNGDQIVMGHLLPRRAVRNNTWLAIVSELGVDAHSRSRVDDKTGISK
ncbi:MAG TPA: hypothetical protein VHM70_10490 [Polyangiaceae bacterium]|jgi:hypothetical protein|nr:hypothetical protein [Polyangiaceae bacterium]